MIGPHDVLESLEGGAKRWWFHVPLAILVAVGRRRFGRRRRRGRLFFSLLRLGLDPSRPSNVLTLFVNMTLMTAAIGMKERFTSTNIERYEQMRTLVAQMNRHLMQLEEF
jgi:hypothetical protein